MTTSDPTTAWLPIVCLGLTAVGCGSEFATAPVSGVVTLDGQPLGNASVYFQPQRRNDSPVVGPPSLGVTDAQGRYELQTSEGASGALVGDHVVSISTFETKMVDPQNSDRLEVVSPERVPPRYRSPSEITMTVPSGGSDEVNFDLTSK